LEREESLFFLFNKNKTNFREKHCHYVENFLQRKFKGLVGKRGIEGNFFELKEITQGDIEKCQVKPESTYFD